MQLNMGQDFIITPIDRERLNGHRGFVLWFTGLSGAGKTTLALHLEQRLHLHGFRTFTLDGDHVRHGLNRDLGFAESDRKENLRRAGEVAKLMADAGLIVLAAFISPFSADREVVRSIIGDNRFFEIHVDCPLEVCETRDPKGMYQMARSGKIKGFTGIDSPYEVPANADLMIQTDQYGIEQSLERIIDFLAKNRWITINHSRGKNG